ncbi:MAG: hypothetical protein IPJ20_19190 [Flammeovirgaceae bacterium]|nr:hypothetical protein [Flammeovirgaceae bacterium]
MLNANISYDGDLANGTDEVDKDQLKSYDYGLSGGIGFTFGAVQVGGRYNYGLVKIADSDGARALLTIPKIQMPNCISPLTVK